MLRALDRGGMSEIWLAEQVALTRPVAIKLLTPGEDFEARVARFRQEAATIARFDHPNVVGIIEFGQTADGRLYYSMPYVANGSLIEADLLGDSARLRTVLSELLQALAYVHRHGVVHRDVKPENVLFDGVGRARLTDFGVSRIMTEASRRTRAGETFGSSYYMSPEQARGELPDGRSDLYSVGVLAYELLVGEPPFQGPDHLSIVIAHLQNPVPRLPEPLRHWQQFIDTAMAKRPEQRYPDAETMRVALQRIPNDPAAPGPVQRLLRHPAFALGMLAASTLGIVVTGILLGLGARGPESAPAAAVAHTQAPVDLVYDEASGAVVERAGTEPSAAAQAEPQPAPGSVETGSGQLGSGADALPAGSGASAVASDQAGTATEPASALTPGSASDDGSADPTAPQPTPSQTQAAAQPAPAESAAPPRPAPASARPAGAQRSDSSRTLAASIPDPGNFAEVPGVPLLILGGERELRLQRIDALLELGRRNLERERARYAALTERAEDRAERRRLAGELRTRERNYTDWRRRVQDLRQRAESD